VSRSAACLLILMACVVAGAVPAFGQTTPGKAELTIVPGGWISFAKPETAPNPSFGEYVVGGAITVNWTMLAIEAELLAGLRRAQDLEFGSAPSVNKKTPPVFMDAVSLVFPLVRQHAAVPYVSAGIGETTFNRLRDVGQADTETFVSGFIGGGVKWYSSGRWGVRGDYRFIAVRAEDNAPGTFTGRQRRNAQRFYGALVVKLIP